jgi:hypothetical protein
LQLLQNLYQGTSMDLQFHDLRPWWGSGVMVLVFD